MDLLRFSLKTRPHSEHGEYTLVKTIHGHIGNVTCIEGKPNGGRAWDKKKDILLVASAGDNGVFIWDTESGTRVEDPGYTWERGKVSAMAWVTRKDEDDALIWGTGNGNLAWWAEKGGDDKLRFEETWSEVIPCPTQADPCVRGISAIAYDEGSFHIAASTFWGGLWLYKAKGNRLEKVWSFSTETMPMWIDFSEVKGGKRDILLFSAAKGIFEINTKTVTKTKVNDFGGKVVHAKMDADRTICCLSDPSLGAVLYKLDGWTRQKSFPVPVTKIQCMKQVALAANENEIAVGSDHGKVYIWDRKGGHIVDILCIASLKKMVQVVGTAKMEGSSVVITARSQKMDSNPIYIWKKNSDKGVIDYAREAHNTFNTVLRYMLWFLATMCVLQNLIHFGRILEHVQDNIASVGYAMERFGEMPMSGAMRVEAAVRMALKSAALVYSAISKVFTAILW